MLKLAKRLPALALACAALACCLTTSARADSLVLDPVGDTFGDGDLQHDITSASAIFDDAALTFTVNFAGRVFAPSSENVF
ncbi:hypothetical protein, partial [Streptococcus agalactiae]|uniref:hypothetical protein n=1 Tax=Streptococcus agalactiae TaxID=1311 RepID=UPI00178C34B3